MKDDTDWQRRRDEAAERCKHMGGRQAFKEGTAFGRAEGLAVHEGCGALAITCDKLREALRYQNEQALKAVENYSRINEKLRVAANALEYVSTGKALDYSDAMDEASEALRTIKGDKENEREDEKYSEHLNNGRIE